MSRKKIKADNVEQLFEIVRAIQNGEEPDEALRRKKLEGAPEADSPESYSRNEASGKKSRKKTSAKSAGKRTEKQDGKTETSRHTGEKTDSEPDAWAEAGSEARSERDFEPEAGSEARSERDFEPEAGSETDSGVRPGSNRGSEPETEPGPESDEEWESEEEYTEDDFDRMLEEDEGFSWRPAMDRISSGAGRIFGALKKHTASRRVASTESGEKSRKRSKEDELEALLEDIEDNLEQDGDSQEAVFDKLVTAAGTVPEMAEHSESASDKEETVQADRSAGGERGAEGKAVSDTKSRAERKDTADTAGEAGPKDTADTDSGTDREKAVGSEGKSGRRIPSLAESESKSSDSWAETPLDRIKSVWGSLFSGREKSDSSKSPIGARFSDLKSALDAKGIHRREVFMLAMGLVLVVLIIVLISGGLSASRVERAKSQNVTADEGLTVTVEQQPEQWSSSYPVVLRFRAQGQSVSQVTVNGQEYVPDENGQIVVTAEDYLLEAEAVTDQGTLSARIEIPMIDSQPPVVNVSREDETITVTAADARSTVAGIYYAEVHTGDFIEIPGYQLYSEPLTYEADTTYYFYAVDKAGNSSAPIVTTTETAEEMSLDTEELNLFPEETSYLSVQATPSNALLNNLQYESANPDVVTVSGTGEVTAVGEGNTVIHVSADGVDEVACPVVVSQTRTVTISAIGDCTLGTDETFNQSTSFDAFDAVNGHGYFFQNVKDILENDDATFANLEGPLTTSDTKTTVEMYAFKGDPSYTEVLEEGSVEVVTLANNHVNDYGTQGLEDTKAALEEAGIDYCVDDEIAVMDVNGIKTAFIGIYELNEGIQCESRVRETIAEAKDQGARLVIVAFHWGSEKSNTPDETQQSLAHTAIDCGADLVVGHHPHVLQGIEKYNGKYIVYSLGNFCFGGNSAPSDMDTIIFRQTFSITGSSVETDDQIEIVPCSISSEAGYNNYQPTPATGTEADRIIERLNEYSSSFGQTFTASDGTGDPDTSQDGTISDSASTVPDSEDTQESGDTSRSSESTVPDSEDTQESGDTSRSSENTVQNGGDTGSV